MAGLTIARVHRRTDGRLLGQFPADDIETTMRTLQGISKQAEADLAATANGR